MSSHVISHINMELVSKISGTNSIVTQLIGQEASIAEYLVSSKHIPSKSTLTILNNVVACEVNPERRIWVQFCIYLTSVIFLNNYYGQFYHPFHKLVLQ
jgi:hypothetical protein